MTASTHRPVIGITMGDPAGIGPELCLRALQDPGVTSACVPLIFGDADLLQRAALACGIPFTTPVVSVSHLGDAVRQPAAAVIDCGTRDLAGIRPGTVSADAGRAAADSITAATHAAMARQVEAIVTAPIHKEALHAAGLPYPGHTEMLTALTGAASTRMMMASDAMTVSLVTIHEPLARVPGLLTTDGILETVRLTHETLVRLGTRQPRITVCGLNPHAGENGLFGNEEAELIRPAVAAALAEGVRVRGPRSPDTAFCTGERAATDAYVVMYHDQGLIPFKMLAFETGVNITLGLPIVRTSVDHGTAFDMAWQGTASPTSLYAAIQWAIRLAARA